MATKYWRGTTDGNPTDTANWSGGLPINGDDAVLDQAPTTAIDGGDLSTISIVRFVVSAAYDKAVGSAASYLKLKATTLIIDAAKTTGVFIEGDASGKIATTYITKGGDKTDRINLKGTFTHLYPLGGKVTIGVATIETTLRIGKKADESGINLIIDSGATLPSTTYMQGGRVTCAAAHGTLEMLSGRMTQTGAITTKLNMTDGTLVWNGGNIGPIEQWSGKIDASGNPDTRTYGNYTKYGGTANFNDGGGGVTCTGTWTIHDTTRPVPKISLNQTYSIA